MLMFGLTPFAYLMGIFVAALVSMIVIQTFDHMGKMSHATYHTSGLSLYETCWIVGLIASVFWTIAGIIVIVCAVIYVAFKICDFVGKSIAGFITRMVED